MLVNHQNLGPKTDESTKDSYHLKYKRQFAGDLIKLDGNYEEYGGSEDLGELDSAVTDL